jgi:DNA-binding transcriptional MerR regulator
VSEGLRSGQLAAAAGVNLQTLRYYERRGLLAEPDRTLGGHRVYASETVTVLRVIKAAQRLGFTLDDVAALLEAGRHHHGRRVKDGLQAHAAAKLAEVEASMRRSSGSRYRWPLRSVKARASATTARPAASSPARRSPRASRLSPSVRGSGCARRMRLVA